MRNSVWNLVTLDLDWPLSLHHLNAWLRLSHYVLEAALSRSMTFKNCRPHSMLLPFARAFSIYTCCWGFSQRRLKLVVCMLRYDCVTTSRMT